MKLIKFKIAKLLHKIKYNIIHNLYAAKCSNDKIIIECYQENNKHLIKHLKINLHECKVQWRSSKLH